MIPRTFLTLLVLILVAVAPAKAQSAGHRTGSGLLVATAPNGQLFIVKEERAAPLVVLNTWLRVGARNEGPHEQGISHFLEHMLFNGTAKRTKEEYHNAIFAHGISKNASTSYDWTNYYLQGPAEHFALMADLHADILIRPLLTDAEFTREREVVKEELRRAQDNPGGWLFRQMMNTAWSHANYGHQVLGSMESLNAQSNQLMRDYYHKHYAPNNSITVAIGDFDADAALAALMEEFADWPRKTLPPVAPVGKDPQRAPRLVTIPADFEAASQMLAFKAPAVTGPEAAACEVLMSVLGQGASSRLVRRLRDELGLVSGIRASSFGKLDATTLYVSWELLDPAQATAASEAVLEVLARMRQEGPAAEELATAKRQIAADRIFRQEQLLQSARELGAGVQALGLEGYEGYLDRVFGVTAQDVQWIAQQYLRPGQAVLGLVGPPEITEPAPEWAKLDPPLTPLMAPRDLGRRGQSPLAQLAALQRAGEVPPAETFMLPNGITVHLEPSAATPTVAYAVHITGGLMWEDWDTCGAGALLLNSLRGGTAHRDRQQIAKELDQLGTALGTVAGREDFGIRLRVLASDAKQGLDLLSELVLEPAFPAEEVAQEREQVLRAIAAGRDDMLNSTLDQVRYALHGDTSYGRPTQGRASVVAALTEQDLAALHRRMLHPANIVIAVCGLFEPAEMTAWLRETFGTLEASAEAQIAPEEWAVHPPAAVPEGAVRLLQQKEKAQAVIALGLPAVGATDPRLPAVQVMHTILGSSSQGRLFRILRGKEGLAYGTYTSLLTGAGTGSLIGYISTRPEMYEQAVTGIRREMRRLAQEGPEEGEMADAIAYLTGQIAQRYQGHLARAGFAAQYLARLLPVDYDWQQLAAIQQVTLEEVKAACTETLRLENHWLAVSGPLFREAVRVE